MTTCWLCRIIGHKWTLARHRSCDSVRLDELLVFGACLRCGAPAPDALMQGAEDLAHCEGDAESVNAAYAAEERAEAGEGQHGLR
jgi:hypothetical protein